MNCKEAKQISIVGYLKSRGLNPAKIQNGSYWYCSPFREEDKASFKVDVNLNMWYDHGEGYGGDIIKLVCVMDCTNESGALKILEGNGMKSSSFSFQQQKEYSKPITLDQVRDLQNTILMDYVKRRGIPIEIANRYVKQAYWNLPDKLTGEQKRHFGVAFKNDLGGYELRHEGFKSCTAPKTITTIPGTNKTLNLFEGFFNFLSYLTYSKIIKPSSTSVVLNTLSNLNKVWNILPDFETINLYLDNDNAGDAAKNRILKIYPNAIDHSRLLYPNFNDLNDFLVSRERSERITTVSEANTK